MLQDLLEGKDVREILVRQTSLLEGVDPEWKKAISQIAKITRKIIKTAGLKKSKTITKRGFVKDMPGKVEGGVLKSLVGDVSVETSQGFEVVKIFNDATRDRRSSVFEMLDQLIPTINAKINNFFRTSPSTKWFTWGTAMWVVLSETLTTNTKLSKYGKK